MFVRVDKAESQAMRRIFAVLLLLWLAASSTADAVVVTPTPGRAPRPPDIGILLTRPHVDLIASPNPEAVEGGDMRFEIRLKTASARDVVIGYSVSGTSALERESPNGRTTIIAGQTRGTIQIPTVDDAIINGDRSMLVTLTSISGRGTLGTTQARGIIRDNDRPPPPPFAFMVTTPKPVAVEGKPLQFEVRLRQPWPHPLTISYRVTGIPNLARSAQLPTMMISEGESRGFIRIPTLDDSVVNGDRTVTVTLTAISGDGRIGRTQAEGIIKDNDKAPEIPVYAIRSAGDGVEGGELNFTVTASRAVVGKTQRIWLKVDAPDGALVEPWPAFAVFRTGETVSQFTLVTTDDSVKQPDRMVSVTLLPTDAIRLDPKQTTASAMIRENDPERPAEGGTTSSSGNDFPNIEDGTKIEEIDTDIPAQSGDGWILIAEKFLPLVAAFLAAIIALWATARFVLPRFYRVKLELGPPASITAESSGNGTILPPHGGLDIELGDAISISIGDCPILSEEEHDDPDDRN